MKTRFTDTILREIDFDLPERRPDAVRLADDCLRLFATPDADFRWVKEQGWYRRIWSTFGRDDLVLVGLGCKHLAQARGFVLELIRLLAGHSRRAADFLELFQEEIAHVQARRGTLPERLSDLSRELGVLRERLEWRSVQLDDERALPESLKLLVIRAMIAAAWADGNINDAEIALISRKISSLGLSREASRRVLAEIRKPGPLDQDLASLEDYSIRLHLYRNIAAVTVADGKISLTENLLLAHLAEVLRIEEKDSARLEQELFAMVSTQGLQTLVRTVAEGIPEEIPERATRLAPEVRQEFLAQSAELWTRLMALVSRRSARVVLSSLRDRLRALSHLPHVGEVMEAMDASAVRAELLEAVALVGDEWDGWMDETVRMALPRQEAGGTWSRCAGDEYRSSLREGLAPLLDELERLEEAQLQVQRVLEDARGGEVGPTLLRALADPSLPGGLLWALGDPELQRHIHEQRLEQTVQSYFEEVRRVLQASELARERVMDLCHHAGTEYLRHVVLPHLAGPDVDREEFEGFLSVVSGRLSEVGQ